jgi:hypothetical protein
VIREVPADYLPEPLTLERDRFVHASPQFLFDRSQPCPHPVPACLPLKLEDAKIFLPVIQATGARAVSPFMKVDTSTQTHTNAPRLLYDRKEAARQLSISIRSLDYMIAGKKIAIRHIGSRILVPHEELMRSS